ncbi:hypothetical protein [Pseudonocardia acaciae]|uniref:hypothetical protein n=1 Tax=Pseudonocardia acaciae TaxID=551276 RepID=UPI00048A699B|nr:hypothetical protein [Pseudonocardia acaciae]
MIWLVWRRQRTALLLSAAILLLAAVTLTVGHIVLVTDASSLGVRACLDAPRCRDVNLAFMSPYPGFGGVARIGLWAVAPLVGWICGVGLYGRELQQRTHLLALTQRTSRLRWWAASLTVVIPPALGMAALTALAGWALRPFDSLSPAARIKPLQFDITGVAPVGSLLLAFAIAAAAGALLRGTMTATVATVLAWSAIFLAVLLTRYDYLPDRGSPFRPSSTRRGTSSRFPTMPSAGASATRPAASRYLSTRPAFSAQNCHGDKTACGPPASPRSTRTTSPTPTTGRCRPSPRRCSSPSPRW